MTGSSHDGPKEIVHRFGGLHSVIEGPLHSDDGHVVQMVVRREGR